MRAYNWTFIRNMDPAQRGQIFASKPSTAADRILRSELSGVTKNDVYTLTLHDLGQTVIIDCPHHDTSNEAAGINCRERRKHLGGTRGGNRYRVQVAAP